MSSSELDSYISDWIRIEDHPLFHELKFDGVAPNFRYFRLIERDGNCFYSSFLSQFLENVRLMSDDRYRQLIGVFEEGNKYYEVFRDDRIIYKDFYDTFLRHTQLYRDSDVSISEVSKMDILAMITYMKILTTMEMVSKKEEYQPFLVETSIEEYCKKNVDPLFKAAEHMEIQALANLLKVSITIISVKKETVETNVFGSTGDDLYILHIPNHFEPIK